MIADQVEELRLFPKHPEGKDTFQPYWADAADDIQSRAWGRAKELYGDPLPEIVQKRLEKELGSIVGYGFSTLYSIAQKLVSKSLSDGYLVGSRGSVGSSFVATMCGITEVNPLPPHYRCDHCHKMFLTPPELGTRGRGSAGQELRSSAASRSKRTATTSPSRSSWASRATRCPTST